MTLLLIAIWIGATVAASWVAYFLGYGHGALEQTDRHIREIDRIVGKRA